MKQFDVLIIGGGFGGFAATRGLLKAGMSVQVISSSTDFLFTPLLIDGISLEVSFDAISFPLYDYFRNPNFSFVNETVTSVDCKNKTVATDKGTYKGKYIVFAQGSVDRVIPIPGREHAYHLKTISEGYTARQVFAEKVKNNSSVDVTIIGAGVTGVELAFAFSSLAKRVNKECEVNIRMLDAGSKVIPHFTNRARKYVLKRFKKEGIEILNDVAVKSIDADAVNLADKKIKSDITFLTVGVVPNTEMVRSPQCNHEGDIIVNEYLQLPECTNLFAVGDVTTLEKWNIPKLAQVAMRQGESVAVNIPRHAAGKPLKKYSPQIKGRLLSLGEWRAVAEIPGMVLTGPLAYFVRTGAYIFKMPGFSQKFLLLGSWLKNKIVRGL